MVNLWRSLRFLVVSVVLLGLIYPLIITGIGQLV
ncbi:potassium-transporting ATPase subunit C, partial [Alicyclobacillus tolerans]